MILAGIFKRLIKGKIMRQLEMISDTIRHFYMSLALQGVVFIALGVLILIYPATLVALFVAGFVIIGASLLVASYKVYTFWKKLPSFMKKD
jgi:hypothetical protein